eukprot:m.1053651 g.1053651  ORF g.1053651 m.1053651 type:complete len:520 (-) comp24187_c1_seq24:3033-4592(-)
MTEVDKVNIFQHHESVRWGGQKKQLPVTIVTGPLGAGKTTVLQHMLANRRNLRIAVAINDFASINIDSESVKRCHDATGIVELTNGCICCTKAADLASKVWSILQDADSGSVDYLVIETSGVSDPCTVVRTLEADFGKMYRVRLDSVVLVLDADDISNRLDIRIKKGTATDAELAVATGLVNQLKCADVILLNKCDITSAEDLVRTKGFLARSAAGARIHECQFGKVPLSLLLEVRDAATAVSEGVVTHEAIEGKYALPNEADKILRTSKLAGSAVGLTGHISDNRQVSMVFEASTPLQQAAFQDFLGPHLPAGIVRMKGWIFFAEDTHGEFWHFHYSGRQRFECTRDHAATATSRAVRLVLIGEDLDVDATRAALQACCHPAPRHPALHQRMADAVQLITGDLRLDVVDDGASSVGNGGDATVCFRMTAARELCVSVDEMASRHGVNFDSVNEDFCARINYANGPSFMALVGESGNKCLRFAANGSTTLADHWPTVTAAVEHLMQSVFSHVHACRCGW